MPQLPKAIQTAFAPQLALDAELAREALVAFYNIPDENGMNMSQVACWIISNQEGGDCKKLLHGITDVAQQLLAGLNELVTDLDNAKDDPQLTAAAAASARTLLREVNESAKGHIEKLQAV
ncbi:MAG: hypothetical protein GWN58_45250 [Anaerolineae bacterium]|nr:hypothetical protein [Anaerolineae bacterium]